MTNNEQEQPKEELGEDPEVLEAIAEATGKLADLLRRNDIELDYCEADWKDTEELITGAFEIHKRYPNWKITYISGDEFGIDSNYVFFTSKPVDDDVIHEAAELIVDEGAELPEPYVPKCPKCGEELECLTGVYPALVPARACIVNGEFYTDIIDGIKISDCIDFDSGVDAWHCPNCDSQLFKEGDITLATSFLKGKIELYYDHDLLRFRERKEKSDEKAYDPLHGVQDNRGSRETLP